ncbi:DUF4326 domain-containing protein [Nesterenkonia rhizosphaerae]|uniref:DUF4326 domain-containing protein n=1 Tax=Nesterenkonia rhizosphaerae TaxID=1348272 RepID=UPI003CD0AD25
MDRTSRWGNPWVIRRRLENRPVGGQPARWRWDVENSETGHFERSCESQEEAHRVAAEMFREWTLEWWLAADPGVLGPLRGRDLACWCGPGLPCHADVLLEVANG